MVVEFLENSSKIRKAAEFRSQTLILKGHHIVTLFDFATPICLPLSAIV
jgi:hypothetical protein